MKAKSWTLYMVENKLGSLYTGICTDLERRFSEHSSNGKLCARALKGKGPLSLKFAAKVGSHSQALKIELWLKKQARQHKLSIVAGTQALPIEHQAYAAEELKRIQQQQ
ncbi:GIY-YIG nuclease family protein [Aliiglaciecola sp. LCG003]|uniref:GIY-YIG nuclease family protein n=1 Tax=Aliiglaciecola sp. LCG003 TaxID=3053655 RepID=UPI00257412D3|nr:GIY-YIG nuclease family protein [Aliiglaciecola sp. LCG003]WJG10433.1 GIY-YIG nuclease family protein [Aliiglaciecola sp. LCG003]